MALLQHQQKQQKFDFNKIRECYKKIWYENNKMKIDTKKSNENVIVVKLVDWLTALEN